MNFNLKIKNNLRNIKIDELMLFLGIVFLLISQLFKYYNAPYSLASSSSKMWEQLGSSTIKDLSAKYVGLACVLICSFLQIKKIKTISCNQALIVICCLTIVLLSIGHFLVLGFSDGFLTSLYYSTNPIVYVMLIGILIGSNEDLVNKFLKVNKYITIFALIVSLYYFCSFKLSHPNGLLGNSAFLNFFTLGFFSALITCYRLKSKIFAYLIILLCIILAFCASSRSFIIQSLLFLFIYTFVNSKRKFLSTFSFFIVAGVSLMIAFIILQKYFPTNYEYFMYKMFVDTRSSQYEQLFSQINISQIIFGGGHNYQYVYNGTNYSYFDNSYVFLMMRYGLIFLIPFVYICLSALLYSIKNKKAVFSLNLIQWLAALGGLAIYLVIGIDLKFLIFYILLGYLIFNPKGVNCE